MRLVGLLACVLVGCPGPPANLCAPACGEGRICCEGKCVNPANDGQNCGACGTACDRATSFCESGACRPPPCSLDGGACAGGALCCGAECCSATQLCCVIEGPVGGAPPSCFTPTSSQASCPQGCAPACVSDVALKRDVQPVDGREVLERLAGLPISTWSYTTDPRAVRHVGPMAQDFHDAFSLGSTDLAYDPIDAHGVSLVAIQALRELFLEQQARIERLEAENLALSQRVCR